MTIRPESNTSLVVPPEPLETPSQHGHQVELEVGLDFVNTLEHGRAGAEEHLPSAEAALYWLRDHDLMHVEAQVDQLQRVTEDPEAAEKLLTRVRKVREAMRELADASVGRRSPETKSLDCVNKMLRTTYTYYLVPAPDGVSLDHRHEGDPVEGALARLVESIARELSQGHPERLRICANDEC
ncbi:MAG: ABATE domain-containing protein, partial [Candidatus Limnocylindrales bacterium]